MLSLCFSVPRNPLTPPAPRVAPPGVGAVLGPSLGGMLSRPCAPGGLFAASKACAADNAPLRHLPYLLPCVACSAFCAAAGVLSWCMPETMAPRAPAAAASAGARPPRALPAPLKGGEYEPLSAEAEEGEQAALLPRFSAAGSGVELLQVASAAGEREPPPPPPEPVAATRWYRDEQCVLTLLGYGAP